MLQMNRVIQSSFRFWICKAAALDPVIPLPLWSLSFAGNNCLNPFASKLSETFTSRLIFGHFLYIRSGSLIYSNAGKENAGDLMTQILKILRDNSFADTELEKLGFKFTPGLLKDVLASCHGQDKCAQKFLFWAWKKSEEWLLKVYITEKIIKIATRNGDFKLIAHVMARMPPDRVFEIKAFGTLRAENDWRQIVSQSLEAFECMKIPDPTHVLNALLFQLCEDGRVELAMLVVQAIIRMGLGHLPHIYEALSKAWCNKLELCNEPVEIFEQSKELGFRVDGHSCNFIIKALAISREGYEALRLLETMRVIGCEPDSVSYHWAIWGASKMLAFDRVFQLLYRMVVDEGLTPKQKTFTVIIVALGKAKDVSRAYDLVYFLEKHDCSLSIQQYQRVAELCLKRFEVAAAGSVILQMMKKRYIPRIELRQKVLQRLIKQGEYELAWKIRKKLMQIKS